MSQFNQIVKDIIKRKNDQIREEREKLRAEECANIILSAYFAILLSERGAVRIPKSEISRALGAYRVNASSDGNDYVIEVIGAEEAADALIDNIQLESESDLIDEDRQLEAAADSLVEDQQDDKEAEISYEDITVEQGEAACG